MQEQLIWTDERRLLGPENHRIVWVYDGEGRGRESYYLLQTLHNGRVASYQTHKRKPEAPNALGVWL